MTRYLAGPPRVESMVSLSAINHSYCLGRNLLEADIIRFHSWLEQAYFTGRVAEHMLHPSLFQAISPFSIYKEAI